MKSELNIKYKVLDGYGVDGGAFLGLPDTYSFFGLAGQEITHSNRTSGT